MAFLNFSAFSAPGPLRFAKTGYGKRIPAGEPGPGSAPPTAFQHLDKRERYLAFLIDSLPVGAAMDVKTLAKLNAPYGPQAVRKALGLLVDAGHLHRVQTRVDGHWVSLTYWTSERRTPEWWVQALASDDDSVKEEGVEPDEEPEVEEVEGEDGPGGLPRVAALASGGRRGRSLAYRLLAELGCEEPKLALSAKNCRDLEEIVEKWFARGATPERVARELKADLPGQVFRPAALVKYRLEDRMPPVLESRKRRVPKKVWKDGDTIRQCISCGRPGYPQKLLGPVCRDCRKLIDKPDEPEVKGLPAEEVREWVKKLRGTLRSGGCDGLGLAGT